MPVTRRSFVHESFRYDNCKLTYYLFTHGHNENYPNNAASDMSNKHIYACLHEEISSFCGSENFINWRFDEAMQQYRLTY
ncbi:hypothetical protein T07_8288 [Trichinella nelsoni]|uniref:Uncharacterized protein n=1 Tax=Trichinella nelsoni TaxID=6336 RepID=A0A0V0SH27_9BILA|nr:hypothetical protein T07_8288 [Trichinella nelsoni]